MSWPPLPFPPPTGPNCRRCGSPCVRAEAASGRFAWGCGCAGSVFCTFDDLIGVTAENPPCVGCGYYTRRQRNRSTGLDFYPCAVGKCAGAAVPVPAPIPALILAQAAASTTNPPPAPPTDGIDEEFVRLLNHVEAAVGRAEFPTMNGGVIQAATTSGSPEVTPRGPFRMTASTRFDQNAKVGAAGEYFVIQFLHRHLGDQVKADHWRSGLRNLVKQHLHLDVPEYLEGEAEDIVFPDDAGSLTNLLMAGGYLDPQKWNGRQPIYLIEVKSTLGRRNKQFYLSTDQYSRMQQHSELVPPAQPRPTVFMIARVSNLQEANVDLRLYVDPESMRRNRQLSFTVVVEDPHE